MGRSVINLVNVVKWLARDTRIESCGDSSGYRHVHTSRSFYLSRSGGSGGNGTRSCVNVPWTAFQRLRGKGIGRDHRRNCHPPGLPRLRCGLPVGMISVNSVRITVSASPLFTGTSVMMAGVSLSSQRTPGVSAPGVFFHVQIHDMSSRTCDSSTAVLLPQFWEALRAILSGRKSDLGTTTQPRPS